MYIGRFVVAGRTAGGAWYVGYRVSSRSFPNRKIVTRADRAMVVPTADAAPTDNPYISYNCLRTCEGAIVVANGSHVDPIIEKIAHGYPLRDALALTLLAMDYEHDQYNTPRIAAALDTRAQAAYLAIVGEGYLSVRRMTPLAGQAYLLATYELTEPTPIAFVGETPEALCNALFECEYEHPIAALAAMPSQEGLRLAVRSARD
ncbi:MAG: IMP cyclohydrolase [Chloroflexi bacterium]|nr:IMP cyclohydrolase [Chloroflexota bacterium]